ncbi:alpha-L-arabinofuranosidase C-terminal domain-containing protein [Paraflavisolibacter sp. H34]|uniref:alpha-L-arabinofuranosidase C-terminal domain-containing protein n=1 Tax=Huijunlia imazamoxiresistens TaxID=3127457 RepID=UPI00301AD362
MKFLPQGTILNKIASLLSLLALVGTNDVFAAGERPRNEPDSVYLFSYASAKNGGRNGLHFAWSRDREHWNPVGSEYAFLKSDYGAWRGEKRMVTPFLLQGAGGTWRCVWSLNEREPLFAHAASADLVDWGRQSYPEVKGGTGMLQPVVRYNAPAGAYTITYSDGAGKYYRMVTADFKSYSAATEVTAAEYSNPSVTVALPAGKVTGQVHRVAWGTVTKLVQSCELARYKNSLYEESAKDDGRLFGGLKPLAATVSLQAAAPKAISDMLVGVFFEDINYAADGGLYAELVQNRDFEYSPGDKGNRDPNWNATYSWTLKGGGTTLAIDSSAPLHLNNPHYALLQTKAPGAALVNSGFDGIVVRKGERYDLSLFARQLEGKGGRLLVRLVSKSGAVLAQATVAVSSRGWKSVRAVLTPTASAADAELELRPQAPGRLALDMVSLFPQKTFKGRPNGLRADLARYIADIHPRFMRFPGGCVAHGDGVGNIYHWKNTIGPLEARRPQRNLWGYHQSMGLGYFEYFQFCEDIGAAPLPVVAAGVPCQNSQGGPHGGGQQGGIPLDQMDQYIQDILDLVEWANGPVSSKWGKKRAEAGHPKPFNLKYIGVGNEDLISDVFEERFTMIYNALKEKYPEITVIGTVGPFYEGTDYEEGWELALKLKVPMVDEHYYNLPGWFIHNQEYYDGYDRSKPKVYLGEYASRGTTLYNALAEALYLTALERNGDVVHMTSYAPLLAKEKHIQWGTDLIYFNNAEVKPTPGYYVQKLFGNHGGNEYLPAGLTLSSDQEAVKKRVAVSVVRDSRTGEVTVKLVNLLPVPVAAAVDLRGIIPAGATAAKFLLQGAPGDRNVTPVESQLTLSGNFSSELPPYSFTVISFPSN